MFTVNSSVKAYINSKPISMYQIIKEDVKLKSKVYLVDSHSEILEFETLNEATNMCDILNANAKGFKYSVRRSDGAPRHRNTNEAIAEINTVDFYLQHAADYGLSAEVVTFALRSMKEDSSLSVVEAMSHGFNDWVK